MLPSSLARWSDLPYLRRRGPQHWTAACPHCGSSHHNPASGPVDRFQLWGDGRPRGWCRRCLFFAFADGREGLSPQDRQAAEAERRRLAELEVIRLQGKLAWLRKSHVWMAYHEDMGERERQQWRLAGIPDGIQDLLRLGYAHQRTFYAAGQPVASDALTIPFFTPGEEGEWLPNTIQYRLLAPPDPGDKYRFMAGLPAPLYRPDPDKKLAGVCLLAEGAKKAIVGWLNLGDRVDCVAAVPGKSPSAESLAVLAACSLIYLCLDPDAASDGRASAVAGMLGLQRVRLVSLPVKLDDAFVVYKARPEAVWSFFRQARPA